MDQGKGDDHHKDDAHARNVHHRVAVRVVVQHVALDCAVALPKGGLEKKKKKKEKEKSRGRAARQTGRGRRARPPAEKKVK